MTVIIGHRFISSICPLAIHHRSNVITYLVWAKEIWGGWRVELERLDLACLLEINYECCLFLEQRLVWMPQRLRELLDDRWKGKLPEEPCCKLDAIA